MPFYSTLKSLFNEHIFEMTYFPGHMHFNYCSYILVLVDSCVPGDMVTITGIVKVTSTEERKLI